MANQKYWFNLTIGSFRASYSTFVAFALPNSDSFVDFENNFLNAVLKVISRLQQRRIISILVIYHIKNSHLLIEFS